MFNELRSDLVLLYELKQACANCEYNLYIGLFSFLFFCVCVLFIYFFTLQYCIGFAIYQHASDTGVHVFSFLPTKSLNY